jgi:protein ImuA
VANAGHNLLLAELRERLAHAEAGGRQRYGVLPFGVCEVDQHLRSGGLALGALHEIAEGRPSGFNAAATLFAAGILARVDGPILWCLHRRDLFAPGLLQVGLDPARVIFIETKREAAVLAAVEDCLRQKGVASVVGEVACLRLTPSRRLQLAAEESGAMALIVLRDGRNARVNTNAARTAWRVSALPSAPLRVPGVGRARWYVELVRCQGAEPKTWLLEGCDAQGRLGVPTDMADGSLAAAERLWRSAAR